MTAPYTVTHVHEEPGRRVELQRHPDGALVMVRLLPDPEGGWAVDDHMIIPGAVTR